MKNVPVEGSKGNDLALFEEWLKEEDLVKLIEDDDDYAEFWYKWCLEIKGK